MKITAGLGSIDDYPRYVRAGADELFCGYVPFSWSEKYGTVLPLNRREVLNYNVQIGSFSELEIAYALIFPMLKLNIYPIFCWKAITPDVQFIVLSAGAV